MVVTKLYNINSIREHSDLSPIDNPSIKKGHSFIFPGDEIVLCSKVTSSVDLPPVNVMAINSVKMSIIAEKPNIFSEEFSSEFAATRSFELDSFTVAITNANAPIVPWGSDGYAPNINFTQDRNWKLPNGDFRRQVKAFTSHDNGTSEWSFNFWFPVLFRWEYWKSLIAADNDFYNTTLPQNGKNQKWLRYHDPSALPFGWLIKYKLEVFYNDREGTLCKSTSLLNLSNEFTGINDYDANNDYADKEIKTCNIGGTPVNTPSAFIFGDQNTSCFAYFTKQTAWDAGEKDNLSAVFWVEPFEAGGITARTRASTNYIVGSESAFSGIQYTLTRDNGDTITTDNDFILTTDNDGNGVLITFDPLDDKKIICQAEIDYQKLALAYPGATSFTLYCRLYNGTILLGGSTTSIGDVTITGNQFVENSTTETYTVAGIPTGYVLSSYVLPEGWSLVSAGSISAGSQTFVFSTGIGSGTIIATYINGGETKFAYFDVYSGACRMGEEIKQDCIFIPNINPVLPPAFCDTDTHVFALNVFADPTDSTNKNKNDNSDFYFYGNTGVTAITLIIQKYINGAFADVVTITDSAYGNFFAYGRHPDFSGNTFTDDYNKKYTGVFLQWLNVYNAFGAGKYRIKITQTDVLSNITTFYSKAEYCLSLWNCDNTNGTVKIETNTQGFRGTLDDKNIQIDYSTGWKSEIRLSGLFTSENPTYNREYNQYGDSDFNSFRPIIDEQIPKYKLQLKPVPGWIDWYLSTNVLQADQILITDYNSINRHTFMQVPVKDGELSILEESFTNPFAILEIKFSYGQNNLRKRNSL